MRKKIVSICVCSLLTLAVAAAALHPMVTSAYGVFSGVDRVVSDKVSQGESYYILEIVPDGAQGEIGYLVPGSEPEYFQDRLTQYLAEHRDDFANTRENRQNYVNGLIQELTEAGLCGADAPLTAEEYREEYFPGEDQQAAMTRLDFPEGMLETVELTGAYVRNLDNTGDYSANISSFCYSTDDTAGDYAVKFDTLVPTADYPPYNQPYVYKTANGGYYEAVENPMEGGTYYYISSYAYVGEASASGDYQAQLDEEKPYTYTAGSDGEFDFVPGETSEDHPENTSQQVETGHVWYSGGICNQDWFRDKILSAGNEDSLSVRVQTVTESQLLTADLDGVDMIYISGEGTDQGLSYRLATAEGYNRVKELYTMLQGKIPCLIDAAALENCVESYSQSDVAKLVVWALQREPLTLEQLDDADGSLLVQSEQLTPYYNGTATDYAENNIYCMATLDADGVRRPFFTGLTDYFSESQESDGFGAVRALIAQENTLRVPEEYLDTGLTKAGVLQYIINYQNERIYEDKTELRVLDVEPAMGDLYLEEDTSDSRILTKDKIAEWTGVALENITVERMTSAEFIGKIEDMNTEYDMVYFGLGYASDGSDQGDYMNRDAQGGTVYNDSLMDGLIYTHTGDAFIRSPILAGLLDTEYVSNDPSNYLYGYMEGSNRESASDTYGYRTQWSSALGKLVTVPYTINNFKYDNPANSWSRTTRSVTVGNVGVYRSSGNDITESKKKDLEEYVGAKYPVVFAEGFLNADGSVNASLIDNSSVLYAFLDENKEEENVFCLNAQGSPDNEAAFRYYMNMPKLELHFYNPATGQEEQETPLSTGTERTVSNNYGNKIVEIDTERLSSGVYTMRYRFRVDSSVDASSGTRYRATLYLDMNADGKFVSNDSYTEAQNDCLILDADGNEAARDEDGSYILSSGNEYILEKDIPSGYWGMLTWKLEIVQTLNPYIRTSQVGYTIVSRLGGEAEVQVIKVLQVMGNNDWGGGWNLQNDSDMLSYFSRLEDTMGVRFQVTSIRMQDFDGKYTSFDALKDYQMLIFGFQDSYTDMTDQQTLSAVNDFINSGRSVLFTHDTTSFVNVSTEQQYSFDVANDYDTKWLCYQNNLGLYLERAWGYHINQMFRDVLGMDRYGITYNEQVSRNPEVSLFRSTLLKEGQLLDITQETAADGSLVTVGTIDTANGGITTRQDPDGSGEPLTSAQLDDDKDIAYVANSGRTQSYGETHGYTYGALNFHYFTNSSDSYGAVLSKYSWNRYMQWRTLPVSGWRDDLSIGKQDGMYASQVNEGQITHFPYEIGNGSGQGIQIAKTHCQYWQLNMDEDIDSDGDSDIVVWYCLSAEGENKEFYQSSPNDVRNNYYIYSIGNVTYSGVGDYTVTNTDEKKLFLNTIVAAYKTSIKDPTVRFLQDGSRTAQEVNALYVHQDNAVGEKSLEQELSFYYTVSEPNLVTSDKTIYVDYRLSDGTQLPTSASGSSPYITTEAVGGEALETLPDGRICGLKSGSVYKATLHNINSADIQNMLESGSLGITVHTTSEFEYYGDSYGLEPGDNKAPETERTLDVLRLTLFDLE